MVSRVNSKDRSLTIVLGRRHSKSWFVVVDLCIVELKRRFNSMVTVLEMKKRLLFYREEQNALWWRTESVLLYILRGPKSTCCWPEVVTLGRLKI